MIASDSRQSENISVPVLVAEVTSVPLEKHKSDTHTHTYTPTISMTSMELKNLKLLGFSKAFY